MKRLFCLIGLAACSDYEINATKDQAGLGDDTGVDPNLESCDDARWPEAGSVAQDESCLREPTVGSFNPVVEWQWATNEIYSGYDDIMASPAVANLTDDDGDGDIDEDDIPDIVFTNFAGGAYTSPGVLTALSGDGSGILWSVSSPGGQSTYSSAGVALGDLDGDGVPEVCTAGVYASVVCLTLVSGSPQLLWAAGDELYGYGSPSFADMDGDGFSEVIFGRLIFDHNGNLLGRGAYGYGLTFQTFAVDVDLDGQLEVVAGNAVYEMDGTTLWYDGGYDGAPAVGDFDGDPYPEIVKVGYGAVTLTDEDGTLLWSTSLPGGGTGGAPTVADFDGDGAPEVGVAGQAYYTVFDTNGAVLWSAPTSDYSSSITGSSVFDFEGDGSAEVVYADEHNLWIYDGATGGVLMQQDGHASGTLLEYPLIADVDNDGSTEIILASNNYGIPGWNGITIIGDGENSWAPARPIWNQYAYHITNVNNDGSIPAHQDPNWLSWNNFRAGGTELGPSHWLPQLAPGDPTLCRIECDEARASVALPIANYGLLGAPGVEVSVVQLDNAGNRVQLRRDFLDIDAGESTIFGPFEFSHADWGGGQLLVVVDPTDAMEECDEGDNEVSLGRWPCQ